MKNSKKNLVGEGKVSKGQRERKDKEMGGLGQDSENWIGY